jgi:hypothetical protein
VAGLYYGYSTVFRSIGFLIPTAAPWFATAILLGVPGVVLGVVAAAIARARQAG